MKKVEKPKKPLIFYYLIALVILILLNTFLFPNLMNHHKVKDVDYGTFLTMVDKKEVSKVELNGDTIYFTDKSAEPNYYETTTFEDPDLVNRLEEAGCEFGRIAQEEMNPLVSFLLVWVLPIVIFWVLGQFLAKRLMKKMGGGTAGNPFMQFGKSNAKVYVESTTGITFNDVAGEDEAKELLTEIVDFLHNPKKYQEIGAVCPKGALLVGPPGTGKTLLAKAVAGEANVPFFSMSGSEFVEMFVGVGASRVRDLFARARKNAPCIVFIDEIDAVGRKRGSGQGGGNDEREQTLNQLLVEMDGFGNEETIIVIAATNRPDVLDKALRRPGRFDRQVFVDRPDIKGRKEILEVHARGKKFAEDVNFETVARKTVGLVGADLANILNEAAILAARAGRTEITMADLEEASEKVEMGPEKKSKVVTEAEKLKTAYHEAGHAVINYLYLNDTDPVHKVTIIPRGMAGGYTMSLPNEDRYFYSKEWFINRMKMAYGGRAADELVSGELNTGASSDIQHATSIAHSIVTRYGMNEKFGPILLDGTNEGDMFQSKYYSDVTGKEVDEEIIKLVKTTYAETVQALKDNRDKLDRLAHALCERETIMQEEFEMLMEGKELPPLTLEKDKKKEEEKITEEKENISDENKNDKENENDSDVQTFEIQ